MSRPALSLALLVAGLFALPGGSASLHNDSTCGNP